MRLEKLFFVLSILGIWVVIFVGGLIENNFEGEILDLKYLDGRLVLEVEGIEEEVIIFYSGIVDLKVGEVISFEGRRDSYNGREQIIVLDVFKLR